MVLVCLTTLPDLDVHNIHLTHFAIRSLSNKSSLVFVVLVATVAVASATNEEARLLKDEMKGCCRGKQSAGFRFEDNC